MTEPLATELIEVRLMSISYAATDTHLYEFMAPDRRGLPTIAPGCHIDISLPNGLIRQYSLVNGAGTPDRYVVGIKRDPQSSGGSAYIHDHLRVGMVVPISAPRNHFPLDEGAAHTVLIAGGIGITPIWAMSQRLIALSASWELHYSARSRPDMAFADALDERREAHLHLDDERGGRFMDLVAIVAAAPAGAHLYCCGPAPMLRAFEAATAARPPECVHVEYFTAKYEAATEGGFRVTLARSGQTATVPAGRTILDVVRALGIDVPSSCEQGLCGACETAVLDGVPDHRDAILSEAERVENRSMMICCSGAKSPVLVLDL